MYLIRLLPCCRFWINWAQGQSSPGLAPSLASRPRPLYTLLPSSVVAFASSPMEVFSNRTSEKKKSGLWSDSTLLCWSLSRRPVSLSSSFSLTFSFHRSISGSPPSFQQKADWFSRRRRRKKEGLYSIAGPASPSPCPQPSLASLRESEEEKT